MMSPSEAKRLDAAIAAETAATIRALASQVRAIVVYDLEWNMAEPWRPVAPEVQARLPYEIIEIGAVRIDLPEGGLDAVHALDWRHMALPSFSQQVRPQVHTRLNRFVARVTGRDHRSLRQGRSFPAVYRDFLAFCGEAPCLHAVWSTSDIEPLGANLAWHGLDPTLGIRVLDVQRLFAQRSHDPQRQRSIPAAMEMLGLAPPADLHTAIVDARCTAQILGLLLQGGATVEWPEPAAPAAKGGGEEQQEETPAAPEPAPPPYTLEPYTGGLDELMVAHSSDPDLETRSTFHDIVVGGRTALLRHLRRMEAHCPACDAVLLGVAAEDAGPGGAWVDKGRYFRAQFLCPRHGVVSGRLRVRRSRGGQNEDEDGRGERGQAAAGARTRTRETPWHLNGRLQLERS